MNYNESIHMRLSMEQKDALMHLSTTHQVSMSTALRWMIDYCISDPVVIKTIVPLGKEGESVDGDV